MVHFVEPSSNHLTQAQILVISNTFLLRHLTVPLSVLPHCSVLVNPDLSSYRWFLVIFGWRALTFLKDTKTINGILFLEADTTVSQILRAVIYRFLR